MRPWPDRRALRAALLGAAMLAPAAWAWAAEAPSIAAPQALPPGERQSEVQADLGHGTLKDKLRERLLTTVARSSRAIDSGRLQGEDLAGALCLRAESKADLGDAAAGMPDAQAAVLLVPRSARARQCRGRLHWANGEFARAVADHSQVLRLTDEPVEALYARGQARFYEGRFDLAAADFADAAARRAQEADRLYLLLWQIFALRRQPAPLPAALEALAGRDPGGDWPRPALAMLVGRLSPEGLLDFLDRSEQGDARELARAEAWFYIGQHHRGQGRLAEARSAFEAARRAGFTMTLEHVAAGFELRTLAR